MSSNQNIQPSDQNLRQYDNTNINKTNFNLKELYKLIDCDTIEVVYLSNGDLMIIDENGKLLEKRYNDYATKILRTNNPENRDFIVGDALICSSSELK